MKTHKTKDSIQIVTTFPRKPAEPLTIDETNEFRAMVSSPVFSKAILNAFTKRPTACAMVNLPANVSADRAAHEQAMRLAQMQGWEMFEAALLSQAEHRQQTQVKKPVTEEFISH